MSEQLPSNEQRFLATLREIEHGELASLLFACMRERTRLSKQLADLCDCENPDPESGPALVSMECPVHNHLPKPVRAADEPPVAAPAKRPPSVEWNVLDNAHALYCSAGVGMECDCGVPAEIERLRSSVEPSVLRRYRHTPNAMIHDEGGEWVSYHDATAVPPFAAHKFSVGDKVRLVGGYAVRTVLAVKRIYVVTRSDCDGTTDADEDEIELVEAVR